MKNLFRWSLLMSLPCCRAMAGQNIHDVAGKPVELYVTDMFGNPLTEHVQVDVFGLVSNKKVSSWAKGTVRSVLPSGAYRFRINVPGFPYGYIDIIVENSAVWR